MIRGAFHGIRRFLKLGYRSDTQVARDVDDEVSFHLDMKSSDLMQAGVDKAEAERVARERFGNVEHAKRVLRSQESAYERREARANWIQEWSRDAAHTLRQMRRTPGFAALIIATLALGIGATTAIFSAVYAILLAPLPFAEPDRLVRLVRETPSGVRTSEAGGNFLEFQRTSRTLQSITSYYQSTGNLAGTEAPRRAIVARVSANFVNVMGIRPLLGRSFTPEEDVYRATEVAMISESLWRDRFGGDPAVLGKTLRMDKQSVEIIGVIADANSFPENVELWLPAKHDPEMMADDNRGANWLRLIGRLAPGITLEQANAEFAALSKGLTERFPEERTGEATSLTPLTESLIGSVRQPLWVLLGAVGLVLLIACTNVAALLLGRMMSRERELTVRMALGAGRGRLVRQLLTESTVLGVVAALIGVLLAVFLVRGLALLAPDIPRMTGVRVNGYVLAFSVALGVVTGLVFGIFPAWQVSRESMQATLRSSGRGLAGTRQAGRVRSTLVIGQFALAIVLLAGAGLLIRTFTELRSVDPGFDPSNITAFTVTLPQDGSFDGTYGGVAGQRQFMRDLLPQLESLQGVSAVGASLGIPLSRASFSISFVVEGRPALLPGQEQVAQLRIATPGYFDAMGIAVRGGRTLSNEDRDGTPLTIVVSEQLSKQYFPGEDVIGKVLNFSWSRDSSELKGVVVGVVADTRSANLTDDALATAYVAADQWPVDEYTFILKSELPASVVGAAAAEVVKAVDPELPVYDVRSGESIFDAALTTTRFYLTLLLSFAVLALVLASLGVYGVVSYGVQQRSREIGIRIALGASLRSVQRMVLGEGLRLAAFGVIIGVAGAIMLTGLLRSVLYGVQSTDPLTYVGVVSILTAAAIGACLIPARRAARIDPQQAIAAE